MEQLTTPIVGRDEELGSIERFVGESGPGTLLIEGEAGIGKSTLWSFALEVATSRAARILSWRASTAERGLAFAVLTGLFDAQELEDLLPAIAEPRRHALEVALARVAPGREPPGPGLVGMAVADVLKTLSSEGPLVIGLDDVQWFDLASLDALAFAARRLRADPVTWVVARRSGPWEPGRSANEFPNDPARIVLGPLSVGALGRLIRERLGVAHPRPLLVRLHEACGGNPFVALEVSRSMLARGVEPAPGEPFPVSPEAEPLVRDRLSSLSPDALKVVLVVAMSSDPTVGLLERVMGPGAVVAIDEAHRDGLLVADGERLRPSHPLFASTAYGDASPGELRSLRHALAAAVRDPVERAVHLAATAEGPDPAVADELERAGRTALSRAAPSVGADLFERAAGLSVRPDRRAALRIDSSSARLQAGDADGATRLLRSVLEDVPDGRRRAQALLALGEIVYFRNPPDALQLLTEALTQTEGDPLLEATVHTYIAAMADADPIAAHRSAMAAVEILERPGIDAHPDLLACALLQRAYMWLLNCERLALDDIDRALSLLPGVGDSFITRRAQEVAERCLYHLGRLRESLAIDEVEYRRLSERGQVGLLPPIAQSLAILEQLLGDWEAARRHAQECMDLVYQGEEVWLDRALMAQARVLAFDGELDAAREMALEGLALQDRASDAWEAGIFCALLGFIELSVPDPQAALGHLLRAAEHAQTVGVVLPTVFRYLGDLVEATVLVGNLDLAEQTLERLERPAERVPLPWIVLMVARGRGFLCAARGDLSEAARWFDRAMAILEGALEMPFEQGRTLLARGQARRKGGHRREARADTEAALAIFERLGATAWATRARDELGRISGRAPSRTSLTASERRVAELAAAGQSNREIAAELFLSVRTIESQLSAAYRKLGVRSRSQLAPVLAGSSADRA